MLTFLRNLHLVGNEWKTKQQEHSSNANENHENVSHDRGMYDAVADRLSSAHATIT